MVVPFDRKVFRRLPLADAAFRLLAHTLDDDLLNGVFDKHRGRSFEKSISFPLFTRLVADALLGHIGSAHETFQDAIANDSLDASVQAMYGKLRRVPIQLSLGLFTEAAAHLHTVGTPVIVNQLPKTLDAFRTLAFDGKKIKYVAKKLKAARGLKGNIFGGKMLAIQDLATQQAIAVEAVADGEAADNPLVPAAVERVRLIPDNRPRLWVGDRAFCDYKLLGLLSVDADHFVVRYNTSCGFHRDASQPVRTGKDDVGRPYQEEWGWLGKPNNPHRIRVRKITVIRAAGEDPLIIVTSLLDADRYPAIDLLTLYRFRWGLEVMFQRVVETFDLRHLIGATSQATVFQAMLCLLLYNITLTIRDYVAVGAQQEPKTVSLDRLFDDMVREMTSCVKVLGVDGTLEQLQATRIDSPEDLRRHLEDILGTIWKERWKKAPSRKRRPRSSPRAYICGGHTSVDKILRGKHKEIPIKPSKKKKTPGTAADPPPYEAKKDV